MRKLLTLLTLSVIFLITACQEQAKDSSDASDAFDETVLQGTWKMTAYHPQDSSGLVEPDFVQFKIYTDTHFYFVSFDEASGAFGLSGAGAYTISRDSFTEHLAYSSWDSTLMGSSYTFAYKVEGDRFDQLGVMQSNVDTVPDFQLHEQYVRVEPAINSDGGQQGLIGLWRLEKAAWDNAEEASPVPEEMAYHKLFTAGHFLVTSFNKNTGSLRGNVFGTYGFSGDQLTENLQLMTWDSTSVGKTYSFTVTVDGDRLVQKGFIEAPENPEYKIEEHYVRVE